MSPSQSQPPLKLWISATSLTNSWKLNMVRFHSSRAVCADPVNVHSKGYNVTVTVFKSFIVKPAVDSPGSWSRQ